MTQANASIGHKGIKRFGGMYSAARLRLIGPNLNFVLAVITMTTLMVAPAPITSSAMTLEHEVRLIARESDVAPSEIGGHIEKIIAAAIGDSGEVVFSASLSDSLVDNAILLWSGGAIRVLVGSGDQAPPRR